MISLGNFFFRVRNWLFPVTYTILLVLTRPHSVFHNNLLDTTWLVIGAGIAVIGQAIRMLTIGFDYIERGGKDGKVHASFLVKGGVYAHSRNPMYVGNVCIAIGLLMFSESPMAILVGVPFFLLVYQSITVAEENFLRGKFGRDYEEYCRTVNRFFPNLGGLAQTLSQSKFDWKKAVRKEYGTVFMTALGLIMLPWWRIHYQQNWHEEWEYMRWAIGLFVLSTVIYGTIRYLKKAKALNS